MKKKLVNKKVVNSIGIGIMAFVMAGSPSLTVLASELPSDTVPGGNEKSDSQIPGESTQTVEPSDATKEVENAYTANEAIKNEAEKANDEYQEKVKDEKYEESDKGPVSNPEISSDLQGSQTALGNLNNELTGKEGLDGLNAEADQANTDLNEAVEKLEEGLDKELESLDTTVDSLNKFEEVTTEEITTNTETTADDIEKAQQNTYETEAEAKEAQDKAKAEAAELESAKDEALEQQKEAQEAVEKAEVVVEVLQQDVKNAEDAYNAAVTAVNAANEKLEAILGNLGISQNDLEVDEQTGELKIKDTMSADVKAALQNAWDAWRLAQKDVNKTEEALEGAKSAAGEAELKYKDAKDELTKITGALEDLEAAEAVLTKAEDTEKTTGAAYQDLQDKKTEATNAQTAQTEAQREYDKAKEALKEAQQNLLAKNASDQADASKDAYTKYSETKKDKDKDAAKKEYYAKANEQVKTMIQYQLLESGLVDDVDDVVLGEWVSERGNINNYLVVSYPDKDEKGNVLKDENGNVIMRHEYFDYDGEDGNITVLKKEVDENEKGSLNSVCY